ncbi:MAG: hypothetical protein KDB26_01850 [Microthrixaceae bacterium]|nr:hypothetical protein [Microthrixaceae bacterium]
MKRAGVAGTDDPRDTARQLLAAAKQAERGITLDVEAAITASGATRARAGSVLKTEGSLTRKVAANRGFRRRPERVNDVIRYTAVIDHRTYWSGGDELLALLRVRGYEVVKDLNLWDLPGYKGRNVTVRSSGGQLFEVQVHTSESLQAAESSHYFYEQIRDRSTPKAVRHLLKDESDATFATVPIPERHG